MGFSSLSSSSSIGGPRDTESVEGELAAELHAQPWTREKLEEAMPFTCDSSQPANSVIMEKHRRREPTGSSSPDPRPGGAEMQVWSSVLTRSLHHLDAPPATACTIPQGHPSPRAGDLETSPAGPGPAVGRPHSRPVPSPGKGLRACLGSRGGRAPSCARTTKFCLREIPVVSLTKLSICEARARSRHSSPGQPCAPHCPRWNPERAPENRKGRAAFPTARKTVSITKGCPIHPSITDQKCSVPFPGGRSLDSGLQMPLIGSAVSGAAKSSIPSCRIRSKNNGLCTSPCSCYQNPPHYATSRSLHCLPLSPCPSPLVPFTSSAFAVGAEKDRERTVRTVA
ncbi:uncharacterized protein LOC109117890 [Fukomys damarensis]|uniref:uncharacterized protein LOC109117890 n=1 Tax=Fukomys damarensis TaxID=885580 RepID=UPI001454F1A4|nr:uncharacterized protein LOC109117890 [Fukomys damarensis]